MNDREVQAGYAGRINSSRLIEALNPQPGWDRRLVGSATDPLHRDPTNRRKKFARLRGTRQSFVIVKVGGHGKKSLIPRYDESRIQD
jgi:hypothetical protein